MSIFRKTNQSSLYPTIETDPIDSNETYVNLLLAEKDKRIKDLEEQIERLELIQLSQRPLRQNNIADTIAINAPQPVHKFKFWKDDRAALESHYRKVAQDKKKVIQK